MLLVLLFTLYFSTGGILCLVWNAYQAYEHLTGGYGQELKADEYLLLITSWPAVLVYWLIKKVRGI